MSRGSRSPSFRVLRRSVLSAARLAPRIFGVAFSESGASVVRSPTCIPPSKTASSSSASIEGARGEQTRQACQQRRARRHPHTPTLPFSLWRLWRAGSSSVGQVPRGCCQEVGGASLVAAAAAPPRSNQKEMTYDSCFQPRLCCHGVGPSKILGCNKKKMSYGGCYQPRGCRADVATEWGGEKEPLGMQARAAPSLPPRRFNSTNVHHAPGRGRGEGPRRTRERERARPWLRIRLYARG